MINNNNTTKEKILTPYQIKMRDKKNRFARRLYDKTSNFISKLTVKITFFYLYIFLFFVILILLILSLFNNFLSLNYNDGFIITTNLKNYYNDNVYFDVYLSQIFFKFLLLLKYAIIIHFLYSGKSTILDYIPKRSLSRFLIRKLSWFCALLFVLKFMLLNSSPVEYFLLDWFKNIIYIKYNLN